MGHYLIDTHANPLGGARILDVTDPVGGQSLMNGGHVIRVPDYVSVQDPANVSDLITKKYQGLLAYYAGFSGLIYDDLLDSLFVDFAYPNLSGSFGDRGSVWLAPSGEMRSVMIPLMALPPTQAVITWEAFSTPFMDTKDQHAQRYYVEESTGVGNFICQVSFDNGVHWYPTTDGAVLNIPIAGQGTNFILSLQNISSSKLWLGGWAMLYL